MKKIPKIRDALGLCRFCMYCNSVEHPKPVGMYSQEYFDALCSKNNFPCYTTRQSLVTCKDYKKKKKESILIRVYRCFKTNDWSYLK